MSFHAQVASHWAIPGNISPLGTETGRKMTLTAKDRKILACLQNDGEGD
jgi:hypothetical protein